MAKRICQNCGAALPGGSLFCSRCGAPYSEPAAYCPVCGRTTESRDGACAVCGEPRKGASSDWKVPVIIMVCAILLAGAVLCFYFLGSGKKAPKKPSSQAAVTVTQTATPVIIGGADGPTAIYLRGTATPTPRRSAAPTSYRYYTPTPRPAVTAPRATAAPTSYRYYTPTPRPTATPYRRVTAAPTSYRYVTPTPAAANWPVISLQPVSVTLRASSSRVQSRGGPSLNYTGVGAYSTAAGKVQSCQAWFREGDFVLVDLTYPSVGRRVLYLPADAFTGLNGVSRRTLIGSPGRVTHTLEPSYGPGSNYDLFAPNGQEMTIPAGTTVSVLMKMNNWLFIDWNSPAGAVRLWVPASVVTPC